MPWEGRLRGDMKQKAKNLASSDPARGHFDPAWKATAGKPRCACLLRPNLGQGPVSPLYRPEADMNHASRQQSLMETSAANPADSIRAVRDDW